MQYTVALFSCCCCRFQSYLDHLAMQDNDDDSECEEAERMKLQCKERTVSSSCLHMHICTYHLWHLLIRALYQLEPAVQWAPLQCMCSLLCPCRKDCGACLPEMLSASGEEYRMQPF